MLGFKLIHVNKRGPTGHIAHNSSQTMLLGLNELISVQLGYKDEMYKKNL